MKEICIVNTESMTIWNFCTEETAAQEIERANVSNLADIARYKELLNHPANNDGKFTRWLAQAEAKQGKFVPMTYEEFKAAEREKLLAYPLHEITEERFYEMLDVLPPLHWTRIDGVEIFCMSEMFTGTFSDQYAHDHRTGKYYCKLVDVCDRSTWIHNLLTK